MIHFRDQTLHLDQSVLELDYPIQDIRVFENIVVVLFRPDSFKGSGQFRNLVAYDLSGSRRWTAELPTNLGMDAYYQIVQNDGLVVDSYCSYRCEVELSTGRIIEKESCK